ncbi:unnamed protein product [Sphagnum balticum]
MRDYLVFCSGMKNINDFFTDWIFDGGFPDFSIEHTRVINSGSNYDVTISIRQRSDHTSHYFSNVPLEVAYFDAAGNKTVMVANVSGNCTEYSTSLPFSPVYIALDFDEKISDAVTDQWFKMAGSNHQYEFGVAKMSVNLIQSTDSSLLRASATIYYNGTDAAQGNLDKALITKREDSLVKEASACAPLVMPGTASTAGFKAYPNPLHADELSVEIEAGMTIRDVQ